MAGQIVFLKKNKLDISRTEVVLTASQGQTFVDLVRNRNNKSAWVTTGSVDADNTTLEVDFTNSVDLTFIALALHNFKAYTIKYWNGSSYVDFSTPISVSGNTADVKYHEFTSVSTMKIKLTVTGTMVANSDKFLAQFIATEKIARLNGWPQIKKPMLSRNRIKNKMISGKLAVKEQIGFFSCDLEIKLTKNTSDLTAIEYLYDSNDGFLVWLSGGDETQFSTVRQGFRNEDFFLMKCVDEWSPEYYKGIYSAGTVVGISLNEVVD